MTAGEHLNIVRCSQCARLRHAVRVCLVDGLEYWTCRVCAESLDEISLASL